MNRKMIAIGMAVTSTICVITPSPAESRTMAVVMQECRDETPFPNYVVCIKGRYAKVGNTKHSSSVNMFYALLDEILEKFQKSQNSSDPMTEIQARANTYRAWQGTIDADNKSNMRRSCTVIGNTIDCR